MSLAMLISLFPHSTNAEFKPYPTPDGPVVEVPGNEEVQNPYSQYLTEGEIKAFIEKEAKKTAWVPGKPNWTARNGFFFHPYVQLEDGTMQDMEKTGFSLAEALKKNPKFGFYGCVLADEDNKIGKLEFAQFIQKVLFGHYVKNDKPNGGPLGTAITLRWEKALSDAEFNGQTVLKSEYSPNIRIMEPQKRAYLYFMNTVSMSENTMCFDWKYGLRQTGDVQPQYGVTLSAPVDIRILRGSKDAQVTFHYVWDRDYRKQKNLTINDSIEGRNKGNLIYANGAIDEIPLESLTEPHVSTSAFEDSEEKDQSSDDKGTLVAPTGEVPRARETALYETDPETGKLLDGTKGKSLKKRLTFAQLVARLTEDDQHVYVQIANDLDWPKGVELTGPNAYVLDAQNPEQNGEKRGNHIIAPALDDEGNLRLMKHYYITYRELPSSVVLEKKDTSSDPVKLLPGAEFELYKEAEDGGKPQLIAEKLTTDAQGKLLIGAPKTKDELIALVKNAEWLDKYMDLGIFQKTGSTNASDIYLTPGNYFLRETKAPLGYDLPEENGRDTKFTVTKPTFDNADKLESKTIEINNERIYPVPFELTKVDANDAKKFLEGATFTLYKGEAGATSAVKIAEGLKTDANGKLMIGEALDKAAYGTLLDKPEAKDAVTNGYFKIGDKIYLMAGKYHLVETAAPAGYEKLANPINFELTKTEFGTDGKATVQTAIAQDERIYPVPFELTKVDANDAKKFLEGATFTLYKGEVGTTPEVKIAEGLKTDANGKLMIGEALDKAAYGTLLDKPEAKDAVTNGYFKIGDKIYLMAGKYHLVETAAPAGYEKLANPINFELTKTEFGTDGKATVQTAIAQDERIYPVPVRVIKVDEKDDKKLLEGAVFTLYKGVPGAAPEVKIAEGLKTDAKGELLIGDILDKASYGAILDDPAAQNVATDGYCTVNGKTYLLPGEYYLLETEAPKGYEKLAEPIPFKLEKAQFDATTGKAVEKQLRIADKLLPAPAPPAGSGTTPEKPQPTCNWCPRFRNPAYVPHQPVPPQNNTPTGDNTPANQPKQTLPKTGEVGGLHMVVLLSALAASLLLLRRKF